MGRPRKPPLSREEYLQRCRRNQRNSRARQRLKKLLGTAAEGEGEGGAGSVATEYDENFVISAAEGSGGSQSGGGGAAAAAAAGGDVAGTPSRHEGQDESTAIDVDVPETSQAAEPAVTAAQATAQQETSAAGSGAQPGKPATTDLEKVQWENTRLRTLLHAVGLEETFITQFLKAGTGLAVDTTGRGRYDRTVAARRAGPNAGKAKKPVGPKKQRDAVNTMAAPVDVVNDPDAARSVDANGRYDRLTAARLDGPIVQRNRERQAAAAATAAAAQQAAQSNTSEQASAGPATVQYQAAPEPNSTWYPNGYTTPQAFPSNDHS